MVFELLEKSGRNSLADTEISISKSTITFGPEIIKSFNRMPFVEIYIDRDEKRLGFKAVNSSTSGYKIQIKKDDSKKAPNMIVTQKICKVVSKGKYKAIKSDGMYIIRVKEIALK